MKKNYLYPRSNEEFMEYLIVSMLILIGVILIFMEFLVFPGVTVVGVIGFVCVVAGIYLGYSFYGASVGHGILLATGVIGFGLTVYLLRSKTWKKLSLPAQLNGSVEGVDDSVEIGDLGVTVGRLAPMGNIMVGERLIEAESQSGYIEPHREVIVVKVLKNKVIVKLK